MTSIYIMMPLKSVLVYGTLILKIDNSSSQQLYYVINKKNPNRPFNIIHSETVHYKFALLALLASKEPTKRAFLEKFNINEFVSLTLKIQKPDYSLPKEAKKENYWLPQANLESFFKRLVQNKSSEFESKEEYHIGLSSLEGLMQLDIIDNNELKLFDLFSLSYAKGYIQDIDVRFRKKGIDDVLTFELLSEGEKQKIGIQGAVELFLDIKTLFLLDEPDAFAHPSWQWEFVPELQKTLTAGSSSQAIFVTHSPLVLSTVQDNAFVMEDGKIIELNYLYGEDVDTVLIDGMNVSKRPKEVDIVFKKYFNLIESGKGETDEAKKERIDLEKIYHANHPNFAKADMLRTLYL